MSPTHTLWENVFKAKRENNGDILPLLAQIPLFARLRRADGAELEAGRHEKAEAGVRIEWRVQDSSPTLKRLRLQAGAGGRSLSLALQRSRFLLEVRP